MILYESHKNTIDENFAISMSCQLMYKDKVVGLVQRNDQVVKISSSNCQVVSGCRQVCSPCKKLNRLFQRLSRESKVERTVPQTNVADNNEHIANATKTAVEKRILHPVCKWTDCGVQGDFSCIAELNYHMLSHIPHLNNIPPTERIFCCEWEGCKAQTRKRKHLITHIKTKHSGDDTDELSIQLSEEMARNAKLPKNGRKWSEQMKDAINSSVGSGVYL